MKSISVIIASYNDAHLLDLCLTSIRQQDYDQKKIEIIVVDGGSTDTTRQVVDKHKGVFFSEHNHSPEAAKSIALKNAHNEFILEVDCDNILPSKYWLRDLVAVFEAEPQITACYPWRYTYRKEDKILNRYFSLFGVNDPVAYFIHKADRQSYHTDIWQLPGSAKDKGHYFLVSYSLNNLPTVGANGFLIKREILNQALVDETHFFHIDVNADLVRKGYTTYAVYKSDIIHISGDNLIKYFHKRYLYMKDLYLRDMQNRRYFLLDKKKDWLKIVLYSLYALTLIIPFLDALRGYLRIRDNAWFLHPIVTFVMFWIYAIALMNWNITLLRHKHALTFS